MHYSFVELAKGEGICSFINTPVVPMTTRMNLFRDEFAAHIEHACARRSPPCESCASFNDG
jgi:NADH:ubiquinone oxidoreductase subunit F (NADH-binding)